MSDAAPATFDTPVKPAGGAYFEQRLFQYSPFNLTVTTTLIFVVLFGTFLALDIASGDVPFFLEARRLHFSATAWPAFVLCLLAAASLGMQRVARMGDLRDMDAFAAIFTGGRESAARANAYAPSRSKLWRATAFGLGIGLIASIFTIYRANGRIPSNMGFVQVWFVFIICGVSMLFTRGTVMTSESGAAFTRTLDSELKIDLLRIDKLAVLGRGAARSALIWFVVSAVASLFVVGGDISVFSIFTMLSCAAMGLYIFVRVVLRIHHAITGKKHEELERVRHAIDQARHAMHDDHTAAAKVQGLLAYEARIQAAQEWPFDQTTLARVSASTLIVTIPWFGQAVVAYFVEHLAH